VRPSWSLGGKTINAVLILFKVWMVDNAEDFSDNKSFNVLKQRGHSLNEVNIF